MPSRTTIIKAIICFLAFTVLCACSIWLLPRLELINTFHLSKNSQLGSEIAGLTTPILGICSSVLIYLALTKQAEANKSQIFRNDYDLTITMINQLEAEIGNFVFSRELIHTTINNTVTSKEKNIFKTGLNGLQDFTLKFKNLLKPNYTFKNYPEAPQIISIIQIFEAIQQRLNLFPTMKDIFYERMKILYDCKLEIPLTSLSGTFNQYPMLKDDWTEKIQNFLEKYTSL